MTTATQRRISPETRRHLRELTNKEWGFGHWSNPFTAALTVYVAGVLLNLIEVSPWWVVTGGVVFILTFVAATVAQHTRVLGIVYSAAMSIAVTTWLTYATGHTTFTVFDWAATRDHALVVGIGTIPFGVIYAMLIHGRNEALAQQRHEEQRLVGERRYWHETCRKAGIQGWYLKGTAATPGGQAIAMRIASGGTTYRQALHRLDDLEVALQAPYQGAVRIERGSNAAEVVIHVNEKNMLAETVPLPLDTGRLDITNPVIEGVHEDREPGMVSYAYRSSLTIGQREGGKSNEGNVRKTQLLRTDNTLLWLVDFKQGSVAKPYLAPYAAGQVDKPALDWVVTDIGGLEAMLDALDRIGNARAARRVGDKLTPTHATPALRLDVDEVADVLSDPANDRVARKLVKALRKHRSECIDEDLATQRGTMSFLGAYARDIGSQVGVINVFKLDTPGEVWNTLGVTKDRIGGVDPSTFEHPGTMLTIAAGTRQAPIKVFRVEHDEIPGFARACADRRPVLEPVDAEAAGPAYALRWQTPQARALLVASARYIGADFRPRHATGDAEVIPIRTRPTTENEKEEPATIVAPTAAVPVNVTSIDIRDRLINQFGAEEGAKRYQRVVGARALHAMRAILTDTAGGVLPTRDLIDRMAARDTNQWGDLTAKRLGMLLESFGVQSIQLGRHFEGNPRGYRLADVATALDGRHTGAETG